MIPSAIPSLESAESGGLLICLPFVVLLLLIAILPLVVPRFWEKNRNKLIVSLLAASPVFLYLVSLYPVELGHILRDYLSFIILLGSLYVISGGILVTEISERRRDRTRSFSSPGQCWPISSVLPARAWC